MHGCYFFFPHHVHRLLHNPRILITIKILAGVIGGNLSLQSLIFLLPPRGVQILSIFVLPQSRPTIVQNTITSSKLTSRLALLRRIHLTQKKQYSRIRHLTLRRLMSYIYGAPILDVSRSHTTTHHSR